MRAMIDEAPIPIPIDTVDNAMTIGNVKLTAASSRVPIQPTYTVSIMDATIIAEMPRNIGTVRRTRGPRTGPLVRSKARVMAAL
jgi:hypothetical protein